MWNTFEPLLNDLMKEIAINEDRTVLRFTNAFGIEKYFLVEAECCSSSWIEHIEGVDVLSRNPILEVSDVYGDQIMLPPHEHGDCVKVYFYKFRTTHGYATIEMRNASNGYYGGSITYIDEAALDGYLTILNESFRVLTEDF